MRHRLNSKQERVLVEQSRYHPEEFRKLYSQYFPPVYAYVAYRVGRVQDAEDLVSEAFLKAIEEFNRFEYRGEQSFAAWLFRIAHNLVSDFYRQNRRWEEPLRLEELPELQASPLLPDDVTLQKEKFSYLHRLIGTLSPRRREVIILKFFGGLHNWEIAQVLGVDERTVASHLCRGLDDLHRKYVDDANSMKERDLHEQAK